MANPETQPSQETKDRPLVDLAKLVIGLGAIAFIGGKLFHSLK
jgi:hypothetical protein